MKSDEPLSIEDKKIEALDLFLDAWETALDRGIDADILASTAIFAALTDMIENHGEEITAQMAEGLPMRVRAGEFTLVDEEEDDDAEEDDTGFLEAGLDD